MASENLQGNALRFPDGEMMNKHPLKSTNIRKLKDHNFKTVLRK